MNDDVAIKVESISKVFQEQVGAKSFKEAFINVGKKLTAKKTDKITKSFTALNDINFEVKKGEFFGIVGRNGSGKSTLLKIIAGVYTPTKGVVTINGKLTPFIELGVGFNPELSGRDNVFLNAALLGFSRKQTAKMYDDIVEFAELKDFMEVKLKNYSSGMQVRLAFSVAIRAESDVLLIDEVLAVGDAAFQQKCFNYFEKLKEEKRTVVFVSHDMQSVRRFCEHAVYINNGVLVRKDTALKIADYYMNQNILGAEKTKPSKKEVNPITINIVSKDEDRCTIELKNNLHNSFKEEIYIGISILHDGRSFAEINSKHSKANKVFNDKGIIKYELNTKSLNPGLYEVGAAIFTKHNGELCAFTEKRKDIVVSSYDETRGGEMKLADNWII